MTQESLNKIAKGAFIVILGMIISKFLTYFYRLIIARYLGPEDYGLISLGFAILGFASTFALLGLPQGITRYVAYYSGKKDKISKILKNSLIITIPLSIIIAIILYFSSPQIAIDLFHNQKLIVVIKSFSILLPFVVIANNIESVLKAFKQVKQVIFVRNISESAIQLLTTAILFFLGFKLLGAVFGYIIAIISSAIIFFIMLLKKKIYSKEVSKKQSKEKLSYKELLSFSWPLLFAGTLSSLSVWIDSIFLGYFLDAKATGIYNAVSPTASLLLIIPNALTIIFMPIITEFYSKSDFSNIEFIYKRVAKWTLLLGIPALSIMIIFSKQILNMLFGGEYTPAYLALIIISMGYFTRTISVLSTYILQMLKKTKFILINNIITLALDIVLNIVLIPKFQIVGAAIAVTASTLIGSILLVIESYKFTRLSPFYKKEIKFIVAILPILIIFPLSLILKSVLQTIALIILFLVAYVILLKVTKSFDEHDIEILNMIKNKTKTIDKK